MVGMPILALVIVLSSAIQTARLALNDFLEIFVPIYHGKNIIKHLTRDHYDRGELTCLDTFRHIFPGLHFLWPLINPQ